MWWSILAITLSTRFSKRVVAVTLLPASSAGWLGAGQGLRASRRPITGLRPPASATASASSPAVGTRATPGRPPFSRWPSYATKKNVLSATIGPPSEAPNWWLRNSFLGAGAALKKFREPSASSRKYSKADPCSLLPPDRVTMLTMAPALRPYSASTPDSTGNSSMASTGRMVEGVPNTPPWLMAGRFR